MWPMFNLQISSWPSRIFPKPQQLPWVFSLPLLTVLQVVHHGSPCIGRDPVHQPIQKHQRDDDAILGKSPRIAANRCPKPPRSWPSKDTWHWGASAGHRKWHVAVGMSKSGKSVENHFNIWKALESIIDWPRHWKVVEEDVKMTQVEDVATAVAGSKPISRK